jgi:hypothetical protein
MIVASTLLPVLFLMLPPSKSPTFSAALSCHNLLLLLLYQYSRIISPIRSIKLKTLDISYHTTILLLLPYLTLHITKHQSVAQAILPHNHIPGNDPSTSNLLTTENADFQHSFWLSTANRCWAPPAPIIAMIATATGHWEYDQQGQPP